MWNRSVKAQRFGSFLSSSPPLAADQGQAVVHHVGVAVGQHPGGLEGANGATLELEQGLDRVPAVDTPLFEHPAVAPGEDLHRLAAHDPADHVHHVGKEKPLGARLAGPGQHLGGDVDRVAQAGVGQDRVPHLPALHVLLGPHEERVPAGVEVDHELDPGRLRRVHHLPALLDGGGQGLLHQDVLAGGEHLEGGGGVEMIRGRDGDRVDVAVRKLVQARGPGAAMLLREGLGTRLVSIADERHLARGMGRECEGVVAAPDAGTHDTDPDCRLSRRLRHAETSLQSGRGYHAGSPSGNVA